MAVAASVAGQQPFTADMAVVGSAEVAAMAVAVRTWQWVAAATAAVAMVAVAMVAGAMAEAVIVAEIAGRGCALG